MRNSMNVWMSCSAFVFRHIVRSPVKSLLIVIVALFCVVTLGFLGQMRIRFEEEVNRLYDTTIVSGEIRQADPFMPFVGAIMRNTIQATTINRLMAEEIFIRTYAETGFPWFFLISPDEYGNFPTAPNGGDFWEWFWSELTAGDGRSWDMGRLDPLFGINCFGMFMDEFGNVEHDGFEIGGEWSVIPPLEVYFAEGFDEHSFVYSDDTLQTPIPVIIYAGTLARENLSLGDLAFIGHEFANTVEIFEIPVKIIGVHNGGITRASATNAVVLPHNALEAIRGQDLGYITFRFEIDPAFNRNITDVSREIAAIVDNPAQRNAMPMEAVIHDEELRIVVEQVEQNLLLIQLIYPVAIIVSAIIGAVVSALTTLQSTKTAAIMRVLGYEKIRTRIMLGLNCILVTLAGVAAGLLIVLLANVGIIQDLLLLAGLYILGCLAGSIVAVTVITYKSPLDLLQVKE